MRPAFTAVDGDVVVALASADTVRDAIAAAQAAFPAWRDTPPAKRARIMFRFKQLLEENAELIAAAITEEHGKVVDDARGEFGRGVEIVEPSEARERPGRGIEATVRGHAVRVGRPDWVGSAGTMRCCSASGGALTSPGLAFGAGQPDRAASRAWRRESGVCGRPRHR